MDVLFEGMCLLSDGRMSLVAHRNDLVYATRSHFLGKKTAILGGLNLHTRNAAGHGIDHVTGYLTWPER